MIKNCMEEIVAAEIEKVVKQVDGLCDCQRCREDLLVYALNRLPPKYVVSTVGHFDTKLDLLKSQNIADVTVRLLEASKIVINQPRH